MASSVDASKKLELAKRRLDKALNRLERCVATHTAALRDVDARDTAVLRQTVETIAAEKQHLVGQLKALDGYLEKLESDLGKEAESQAA